MRIARNLKAAAAAVSALASAAGLSAPAPPAPVDLPGERLFPESLSVASDGTIYVGSITGGVVKAAAGPRRAVPWLKPGAGGTGSIFGVLADPGGDRLWLCSNPPTDGVSIRGARPGSWLFAFGRTSGRVEVAARLPGDKTLCNDIAIGPDRAVYVTNMAAPQILRLDPLTRRLAVWASDPRFQPAHGGGLDGIAFDADGRLYVTVFSAGELFRVTPVKGKAGPIVRLAPSRPLVRPDALRPLAPGRFLLVEGGGRIDRLAIAGDGVTVETLKEGLAGPTGADARGGSAWYVEGQFSALDGGTGPVLPFRAWPLTLGGMR